MQSDNRTQTSRLPLVRPCALATLLFLSGFAISADTGVRDIITSSSEVQFGKGGINGSTVISGMTLRAGSESQAGSTMARFTKGTTTKHYHSYDEQVVLLKGIVIHSVDGLPESHTRHLEAGSYWYVPAQSVHQDTCLTEECMIFVLHGYGETKVVEGTQ